MPAEMKITNKPAPYPFDGGYRLISQSLIEDLIAVSVQTRPPASVLRLWCALVESFHKRQLEVKKSLILDPKLRKTLSAKALGIKQITQNYPATLKEFFASDKLSVFFTDTRNSLANKAYHSKLPRQVLKYLSLYGTFSEIIFVLVAATRMMRRQGNVFRINQVEWAKRLGIGRNSLSRAINRLISRGLLRRLRSPIAVVRKHGNQYQFTCACAAFGAA